MDIVDQAFLNAKQVKLKKLKHTIKPAELKNKIQLV